MAATATATAEKPTAEAPKDVPLKPLHPSCIAKHHDGMCWREWLVRLPEGMAVKDLIEHPDLWSVLQGHPATAVTKLDRISIVDYNEEVLAEAIVSSANDRSVVLGKPKLTELMSRMVEGQFEDELHKVKWMGVGFGVVRKRDGQLVSNITTSRLQAERDLVNLRPRRA
jgi:hypothetical protein